MPQLIVIKGPSTGKTIEFSGEATLGRGENNAIVIDDPSVWITHERSNTRRMPVITACAPCAGIHSLLDVRPLTFIRQNHV